jgi:hypothetical protein
MLPPLALTLALAWSAPAAPPPAAAKVDYNFQVRPILADRCFVCHGPDPKTRKAGLRLDSRKGAVAGGAIEPGSLADSEILRRITATDHQRMPPPKSNLSLSRAEVAVLQRWVLQGAEYRTHWAYLPLPDAIAVPSVADRSWASNPLDRFILTRLEKEKLRPSAPASREAWIRRASYDLIGLPPTPDEVDAFLADRSPSAFERVADRLVASPRFGARFALDWLDAARYADSFGYQADGDMHVWPWRDWVVRAFNANLPFDRFITEQLAGDLLPGANREQRLATAFNRLNRMTNEGGSIPEEFRNEYVSDRVHTLATALLGLTLECARCHDHKYDPLTQRDYYALGAFFNSIDEWGTYNHSNWRPTPTLLLPTAQQEQSIAAWTGQVARSEQRLKKLRKDREEAFGAWLAAGRAQPDIPGLVGDYPLDRLEPGGRLANRADAKKPGSTSTANVFVKGRSGQALRFTGDDPANFPGVAGDLERWRPFTVAFWLHLPITYQEAIVFHRSSGTDTGFNGTELTIDAGKLQFAQVRFWPGNAIIIRTRAVLPLKKWLHVAVSSAGTSKAAGLRIYLDGQPAEVEVVRDNLFKDLQAGGSGLSFGERFRCKGLKGGALSELRIYDRDLSPIEVAQVFDGKALAEALTRKDADALRDHYFAVVDQELSKAGAELRQARRQLFAAQTGVFEIMTMKETPAPRQAYILKRGEYDAPKDRPVGRDTPAALPPFPKGAPRNRLGLARWLTEPRHPLLGRVMVNRAWQLFFGRGIVVSAENFGVQGALPSHPELLDWLARDFIASGWDFKRLCKTIVLSSTYRQQSAASRALRERDPDNVLLARAPARRLSAEMLRDSALAAGGLLVGRLGGPPVKPYQPRGLWRGMNAFLPHFVQDKGENLYRRSLYTYWRRTAPPPSMLAFDVPSREVCVARRQSTSTPLQPLVLLNDPQFVEAARACAERVLRQGGRTPAEQLTLAFRLAATRTPTERELAVLVRLYTAQLQLFNADRAGARKFLRTGDRPPAPDLDAPTLAAMSVTASAILNLDAAVMTR